MKGGDGTLAQELRLFLFLLTFVINKNEETGAPLLSDAALHPCRALAHVIRHPASDHMDDIGLGQHYENIHTRVMVKSLREYRPPPSEHNFPQTPGPFLGVSHYSTYLFRTTDADTLPQRCIKKLT